ncbi:MAG TPA: DNA alkylation repair protein [Pseudomonadales bacterium]
MDQHLREIHRALHPHRRPNPFASDLFNSRFAVWHVPAAMQRQLSRSGYGFSSASHARQRNIWRHVWENAGVLELRLQCLWPLLMASREQRMKQWRDIQWFCARIENWCEADYLASMTAQCLEQQPSRVLPVLQRWNRHRDPWLRRQSLTGLFYYQRLRGQQPPLESVLAHLESQLDAPEHYVQKAVGWVLREAWQVYPQQLQRWLAGRLARMQSAALTTMLEKANAEETRDWRMQHRLAQR